MPAYIARDRNLAARNGEEAIIEYLLLSRVRLRSGEQISNRRNRDVGREQEEARPDQFQRTLLAVLGDTS